MERPCRQFRAAVALRMRRYCTMAARSRRQPENEMLRPFRAYRHTILCRDLRPQSPSSYFAFRTMCEGDIEAPGLATRGRGKDGLETTTFSYHIPQLRTNKLLTRYRRDPRGRPQYRRQGQPSFQGDVVSWGYSSTVDFVASSREKTSDKLIEGDSQELDNAGERQPIRISRRMSIRILLRFAGSLAARGRRCPEKMPAIVDSRSPCPST